MPALVPIIVWINGLDECLGWFPPSGPLTATSAWRRTRKVQPSLQWSWTSSFPRHLEGESISQRMSASCFSLSAITPDHTEHRSWPAWSPPLKFPCGFFTQRRKKKANKHWCWVKSFFFFFHLHWGVSSIQPLQTERSVRSEEGKTLDGSPMTTAVITEILFLSRRGGGGGGGGGCWMKPSSVCGVHTGEWSVSRENPQSTVGGVTCWVGYSEASASLNQLWQEQLQDGSWLANRQIYVIPAHWALPWKFSPRLNVATWRVINRARLPSLFSDSVTECSHNCYGNGECVAGSCHCFPGFIGPYCSRGNYPARLFPDGVAFLPFSLFLSSDISKRQKTFTCFWFIIKYFFLCIIGDYGCWVHFALVYKVYLVLLFIFQKTFYFSSTE